MSSRKIKGCLPIGPMEIGSHNAPFSLNIRLFRTTLWLSKIILWFLQLFIKSQKISLRLRVKPYLVVSYQSFRITRFPPRFRGLFFICGENLVPKIIGGNLGYFNLYFGDLQCKCRRHLKYTYNHNVIVVAITMIKATDIWLYFSHP